ncbi:MAG: hypothetical protein J07HR59_00733 [Halorubrum sp. J07HR59]|nr:MAG: hypothetical protein J07HR59_00733 [Halorubrum sp. J07HR59]
MPCKNPIVPLIQHSQYYGTTGLKPTTGQLSREGNSCDSPLYRTHSRRHVELDWGLRQHTATLRRMATHPVWVSRIDGTACEVSAGIYASHTLHRVRRTSHDPQPRPRWVPSGCLRGRRNGLLSHDRIRALQPGEDVKTTNEATVIHRSI